jgi:hypothetical protein
LFEFAPRLYEQIGADAKLFANSEQVRLMCLEEADEGGEQGRLVSTCSELVCPDSGQVHEPLSPPLLTKRCRKCGER